MAEFTSDSPEKPKTLGMVNNHSLDAILSSKISVISA